MSIATEIENDPDVIDGVYYPSEDGKSKAVTIVHVNEALELFSLLRNHFRARPDVLVSCDSFWYWEEGNPKARISPDIMVCLGVDRKSIERSYVLWRYYNVVPSVCFEFAAGRTWRKNLTQVKDIYEGLGVREYFLFDPDYKYLKNGLIGFRLKKGKYVEIAPDNDGSMLCKSLKLGLAPIGRFLRLSDPTALRILPTAQEEADLERSRADAEHRRVEELQKEVERLRAQLHSKKHRTNGGQSRTSSS
jgi:Uma2 family endonuclease